jgi:hypothetical protein
VEQLCDLLLRLSHRWQSYYTFLSEHEASWTNDRIEQGIGWMKMRARSVRSYKTWQGIEK